MSPIDAKRKDSPGPSSLPPSKRLATSDVNGEPPFSRCRAEERDGIINRDFYPSEMSNERCKLYDNNEIPRPLQVLEKTVSETDTKRNKIPIGDAVLHWFKRDLRLRDNRALSMASELARTKGVPLICSFYVSPQDYEAHLTSSVRVDFELRSLQIIKEDLDKLHIPLFVETVDKRKRIPEFIIQCCEEWGAKHVFCNVEYEVDELRREELLTRRCLDKDINFTAVHDDAIIAPGRLQSGSGKQYSVYSPWYRAWVQHIHKNPSLLDPFLSPSENPESARQRFANIFDKPLPSAPPNKTLTPEEQKRFRNLWPAGEHEAHERLEKFLKERIKNYSDTRNFPAEASTSSLSPHLAAGTLAARSAVRAARDANTSQKLDAGAKGITVWISELAWRDFYKHVLAHWPYVSMAKPFKYRCSSICWNYDDAAFERWCQGETGFPIVDAAMRQLKHTGYMHNRCRMIVASFLSKDLLLDWRRGEKWFMLNLVDGDFASNNGGWGFSASVGVDPQPYFRIFNPILQSERFDNNGDYIRKWVPELKEIKGPAIHDPYGRGADTLAERAGYPKMMVDHSASRKEALERYKAAG